MSAPDSAPDPYVDAAPPYSRSQSFRGASTSTYQPGGQPWQQLYASAPPAYADSQPAYGDPYGPYDAEPEPPRRGKKTALVLLLIVALLAALGGAAYLYLGSRPTITVTSSYMVGTMPAGATSTTLHVSGSHFEAHSAVSFFIDGQPEPGQDVFQSDANGAVAGDLAITSDWPLGQHTLTAFVLARVGGALVSRRDSRRGLQPPATLAAWKAALPGLPNAPTHSLRA